MSHIDSERLLSYYEAGLDEQRGLEADNISLRAQVAALLRHEPVAQVIERIAAERDASGAGDGDDAPEASIAASAAAASNLSPLEVAGKIEETIDELDSLRASASQQQYSHDRQALTLKAQLDAADAQAREVTGAFRAFVHQVALGSRCPQAPRMTEAELEGHWAKMDRFEADATKEALEAFTLQHRLAALEALLKEKEALADRLHLIDFEQLKIENRSLGEKIEERNEELLKLRRKTVQTVQVLAHMREKAQAVLCENQARKRELVSLDDSVAKGRDSLARAKKTRDALRTQNQQARQATGFSSNPRLRADFAQRRKTVSGLQEQLAQLKARHAFLTARVTASRSGDAAASPMMPLGSYDPAPTDTGGPASYGYAQSFGGDTHASSIR
jgi:hypothetical protein